MNKKNIENLEKFLCELIIRNCNEKLIDFYIKWINSESNSLLMYIEGSILLNQLTSVLQMDVPAQISLKCNTLRRVLREAYENISKNERNYSPLTSLSLKNLDIQYLPDSVTALDELCKIRLDWDQLLYFPVNTIYQPLQNIQQKPVPFRVTAELVHYIERFIPFYGKSVSGYTGDEIKAALNGMGKKSFPAVYHMFLTQMGVDAGFFKPITNKVSLSEIVDFYNDLTGYIDRNCAAEDFSFNKKLWTIIFFREEDVSDDYYLAIIQDTINGEDGIICSNPDDTYYHNEEYQSFRDLLFESAFRQFVLKRRLYYITYSLYSITEKECNEIKQITDRVAEDNQLTLHAFISKQNSCYENEYHAVQFKKQKSSCSSGDGDSYNCHVTLSSNDKNMLITWDKKFSKLAAIKEIKDGQDYFSSNVFLFHDSGTNNNRLPSIMQETKRIRDKFNRVKIAYEKYGKPVWSKINEFGAKVERPYHPVLLNTQLIAAFINYMEMKYSVNFPGVYYDLLYKIVLKKEQDQIKELHQLEHTMRQYDKWSFFKPYILIIRQLWQLLLGCPDISGGQFEWYLPAAVVGKNIFRSYETQLDGSMRKIAETTSRLEKEQKKKKKIRAGKTDTQEESIKVYDIKDLSAVQTISKKYTYKEITLDLSVLEKDLDYYFEQKKELTKDQKQSLAEIIWMAASNEWNYGSIQSAIKWYKKTIDFCLMYDERARLQELYTYLAACYIDTGQKQEAVTLFPEMMMETENENVLYQQARIYFLTGDLKKAKEKVRKITEKNLRSVEMVFAFILLGDIYKEEKEYDKAKTLYQTAHDRGMVGEVFCYYRLAALSALENDPDKCLYYLNLLIDHFRGAGKNLINFLVVKKYSIEQTIEDPDFRIVHPLDGYKELLQKCKKK